MQRIKIGDLVTCKLWLEPEMAVVVYCYTDNLVKVVMTDGSTRNQFLWDLVVLNEGR